MAQYVVLFKLEWLVALLVFLLLVLKIGRSIPNEVLLGGVQIFLLAILACGFIDNREGSLFGGMFQTSALITIQKDILIAACYLILLLCAEWLKQSPHLPEFLILMFSSLLGMFLMISSGNFLIFFLALELSSIPVAAMANFDLEKRISSEAAMKMILSSAFSSGVLLFGVSLLYGATGTLRFDELPSQLALNPLTILAFVLVMAGFGFKLSVVPFHLWTADVYEGSPIATTAFLSVVSKGSIAFIMTIVLYKVFQPLHQAWYPFLVVLSLATMLTGNFFAIRQQQIKRFLAFSSIAQVGFILVAMTSNTHSGQTAIIYFVLVYVFSNLGAFGVVAAISSRTGKETIGDYRGLYRNNPFLGWTMALALFSLAGIPPTAGFFGKLFLLTAGASARNYWFILVAALNMIISLYYYLNIVRAIFMDKNDSPIQKITVSRQERLGLLVCCGGILLAGLFSWIFEYIHALQ